MAGDGGWWWTPAEAGAPFLTVEGFVEIEDLAGDEGPGGDFGGGEFRIGFGFPFTDELLRCLGIGAELLERFVEGAADVLPFLILQRAGDQAGGDEIEPCVGSALAQC